MSTVVIEFRNYCSALKEKQMPANRIVSESSRYFPWPQSVGSLLLELKI